MTSNLIAKAEAFARNYMQSKFTDEQTYHNVAHVEVVVEAADLLAKEVELKDDDRTALLVAAWFHDLGYGEGCDEHEKSSAQMAKKFLAEQGVGANEIETVERLIMATTFGQQPNGQLECLIQDADMAHFARTEYPKFLAGLRNELFEMKKMKFEDLEWMTENLAFMKNHEYKSEAGKTLFSIGKADNFKSLKLELKSAKKKARKTKESQAMAKKNTEKGRETVFRVTLRNHMQLSKIADNKANIMLSVNAIIVSVILGSLLPAAEDDHVFRIPLLVLLFTCVATIVMATISTIPQVTEGKYSRDDVVKKKVNLLFFGNFHAVPLDEFQWGMEQLLNDEEYLYSSLSKDLYFLGKVLHRKYKFLRYTYIIFMVGMLATVVATVANYI